MLFQFKMPDVGEGISEGEIVSWMVKPGDSIAEDAPLLEVQNDKLLQEIPSPVSGVVAKILVPAGTIARVGDVLIEIETTKQAEVSNDLKKVDKDVTSQQDHVIQQEQSNQQDKTNISHPDNTIAGRILAMPSVRHYARQHGIDLTKITATGKQGHVTKQDVDLALQSVQNINENVDQSAQPSKMNVVLPTHQQAALKQKEAVEVVETDSTQRRERFSLTRKAIARTMVQNKTKIPHVSIFDEVEVSKLIAHRQRFKDVAASQNIKLTYLPYVVKALIAVARKYPVLNASVDDVAEEIIYRNNFNIGIAVDTDQGLYVPNVKHADTKSIFTIAKEIETLSSAAKEGKLAGSDMRGGTITITNVGSVGGMWFTPIINHPEVAIIGLGRIGQMPIVLDDKTIGIGNIMRLSMSFDHRIIDGKMAQLAMNELKRLLADPELLLMEV